MKNPEIQKVKGYGMKDLRGQILGDLKILVRAPNPNPNKKHKETYYKCLCSCGNMVIALYSHLFATNENKRKRSCGGSLGNHKPLSNTPQL